MEGVRPRLMVSDPPYGVSHDPGGRDETGALKARRAGKVRNDDRDDWKAWARFPGEVAHVRRGARHAGTVIESLLAWRSIPPMRSGRSMAGGCSICGSASSPMPRRAASRRCAGTARPATCRPGAPARASLTRALVFGAPDAALIDLPQLTGDPFAPRPLVAAHAAPWLGEMAVFPSPSTDGVELPFSVAHVEPPWREPRSPGDLTLCCTRRSHAIAADRWGGLEAPRDEGLEACGVEILDGAAVEPVLGKTTTRARSATARQTAAWGGPLGPGCTLDASSPPLAGGVRARP